MSPKKAFVTGGTGFLGSHLVDRLLQEGWEVHVAIRRRSNLQWLMGKKVFFHYGDLTENIEGLSEGIRQADVCFHVAGMVLARHAQEYHEANTEGTRRLLEMIEKVNPRIQRVVVVSSVAAHGPGLNRSIPTENDRCHPVTVYGESKLKAEEIALQYKDRLSITIVRPPVIYGPRDTRMYEYFRIARLGFIFFLGRNPVLLNMAYVQDVVTGLLLAAEKESAKGEVFFIGEDKNHDMETVAQTIAHAVRHRVWRIYLPQQVVIAIAHIAQLVTSITGRLYQINRLNLNNFLAHNWTLDTGKAKRLLGYSSQYSLQRGIQETAAWYVDQHWL